jgi:tannase/feruloyl esterase
VTPPVATPSTGGAPAAFSLGFKIDDAFRVLSNTTDIYREASLDYMRADSTDLSSFKARGGKLLIAHGVSDPIFSILDTIDWWKDLNTVNGGRANEFVRFCLSVTTTAKRCVMSWSRGPATDARRR